MNNLGEIRSYARGILLEDAGSDVFTNDFLNSLINIVKDEINSNYDIPFLKKSRLIQGLGIFYLYEDVDSTDTEIKITASSGLSSTGYVYIDGDIVQYTGITTGSSYDTLTGVTGLDIDHQSGDSVLPIYEINNMFRETVEVNGVNYRYHSNENYAIQDQTFTTVFVDAESKYLVIGTEQKIKVNYQPRQTDLALDIDECQLPYNYGKSVIGEMVAGQALLNTGDPDGQGLVHIATGEKNLMNMIKSSQGIVKRQRSAFD